jgi:hypothetical protein
MMPRRIIRPILFAAGLILAPVAIASAQDSTKAQAPKQILSPRDTAEATVGSAKVLIDYSRPSKRGRKIFGELVPYNKVWRTGANAATTLITDKPLLVGDKEIPAGTYTIYTIPDTAGWQLIINKKTGQWGTVYDESQDLVRIPMTVKTLDASVEQFEIAIESDGMLHMRWDTTDAMVSIAEKK